MQPVNTEHKKEEKKIPNLRFPGFEGAWMTGRLEEFCNRISDGIHATPVYEDSGEYFFVNGNNLVDGKIKIDDNTKRISREEYVKHKRDLGDRTILMSINGTIGNLACYSNEKVVLGKSACYINITKQVEKVFIYNTLQLRSIKYFFNSELTGTTIKNLSLKTIKNTNVYIPSLPEQQKIASFLSEVDQKIQQLTRKKELLELYKKGVMQKIFSQEIRFKPDIAGFGSAQPARGEQTRVVERSRNYPDWEEKRLGEIFNIKYGKDYKHLNKGNIPVLGTGGVMTYVDKFLYDKPSVLIGRKGSISSPQFIEVPFWTVDTSFYTEINEDYDPYFVFQIVSNVNWMKYNEATGVPSLNTVGINSVKVIVPKSLDEQKNITKFSRYIDNKIELIKTQINQTKQFKKGLLQQMFV